MNLLLALASVALTPADPPANLVTSARYGTFAVRAEVGGKEGWFLIGTTQVWTYISPSFLKVGSADTTTVDVKVGGFDLGDTEVAVDRWGALKESRVDGVLGSDVLENCALGFDYGKGKVAFWREGRLDRADAEGWIGKETKVDRVRGWMENGALSINVKLGGEEFLLGITPDIPYTILGPKAAAAAKGAKLSTTSGRNSSTGELVPGFEGRITSTFGRADLPPTYLEFFALPSNVAEDVRFGEGVLNPRDLNADRIIFDLPGRCVWVPQVPARLQASRAISRLFEVPIHFADEGAKIGPLWTSATDAKLWEPWSEALIRRFGDVDGPTLAKTLATPGKPAESLLANLYPQLRKGIGLEVEREGKEGVVRTPPLRVPGE
jgi:hypothetical protein